jgi:cell division protease FtsH
MTLGGRAAEDIFFGKISTGAQNDLERITKMAYSMVTIYGMSDKVGNLSFYDPQGEYGYQKPYSEKTSELIDEEVRNIIAGAYNRCKNLLTEKKEELKAVAEELLQKEILFQADLERLIGKRPFDQKPLIADSSAESSPSPDTHAAIEPEAPEDNTAGIEPES